MVHQEIKEMRTALRSRSLFFVFRICMIAESGTFLHRESYHDSEMSMDSGGFTVANMGFEAALKMKALSDRRIDNTIDRLLEQSAQSKPSFCINGEEGARFDPGCFTVRKMV